MEHGTRQGSRNAAAAMAAALVAAAVLASPGCAHRGGRFADGVFSGPNLTYSVGSLPDGWALGDAPPADVSFDNRGLGAAIYVDSSCERYTDASLNNLANHLFYGFDDVEVMSQETLEHDAREALRRVSRARLDGVRVWVAVTVIKKNHCIFDLVLTSAEESFEEAYADYLALSEAFAVERCP